MTRIKKGVIKGVIAAAGSGTRMWPASKSFPKELFPVGQLPALGHVIWEMVDAGISEITIVVRKENGDAIRRFLDPQVPSPANMREKEVVRRFEYMIRAAKFSFVEQSGPYGNGTPLLDAVRNGNDPCVYAFADDVVFGENLTKGLIETFRSTGHPVLAAQTVPAADKGKFGILECTDGQIMTLVNRFVEKPRRRETLSRLAAVGRYLITQSVLDALQSTPPGKNGEIWLSDAFVRLLEKGSPVAAFRLTTGRWHTVGNPEGYTKAVQAAVRAEHPERRALRKAAGLQP